MGGKIVTGYEVKSTITKGNTIVAVDTLNTKTGKLETQEGDYFFSTMPVQELVAGMDANVPDNVKEVAAGLMYRDFVYAGVLVKKMAVETLKDNWIYIQEKNVKVARMQIYNNWGPYMVNDPDTVWLGLEYFCDKGDEIWNLTDEEVQKLAIRELVEMKLVYAADVLDSAVQRMEKTYPAYFGTYNRFDTIREYLDGYTNLFLIGRNGMHKYNNADHSMLTAMTAIDNIVLNSTIKKNIWEINTDQDYQEKIDPNEKF
jgi:protoporphyrinogen oxidase